MEHDNTKLLVEESSNNLGQSLVTKEQPGTTLATRPSPHRLVREHLPLPTVLATVHQPAVRHPYPRVHTSLHCLTHEHLPLSAVLVTR